MKKIILYLTAVLVLCGSESHGGDVFTFTFETLFSKQQVPPNTPGKWLFLGCDSIIPVDVSLMNSDDQGYPYKIKINRKLPKPDSACDRGENIIIRNIKDVLPGRFTIAKEDSIDDSTRSYYTDKDTVKIIKTIDNGGIALSFISGSQRQEVKNESYESAYVCFSGDINKDNHVDFVIIWISNYANKYDVFISRIDKGIWQLKKEAEIIYTD
jgi:hypothetical protein